MYELRKKLQKKNPSIREYGTHKKNIEAPHTYAKHYWKKEVISSTYSTRVLELSS